MWIYFSVFIYVSEYELQNLTFLYICDYLNTYIGNCFTRPQHNTISLIATILDNVGNPVRVLDELT